jgi:hypothetical protein
MWPRLSRALQTYLRMAEAVMASNLMLQLPAFIIDIMRLTPLEDLPRFMTSAEAAVATSGGGQRPFLTFSDEVLSVICPKLQLSYFPVAILVLLPWKEPRKTRQYYNDEEIEMKFLFRQNPKKSQIAKADLTTKVESEEEDLKLLTKRLERSPTTII